LSYRNKQAGFTLVELMVVIVLTSVMVIAIFTFYRTTLFSYFDLQKTASNFTDLAAQSQRVGKVVRGASGIITAEDNSAEMYAYFYPTDAYVSKIKYYLNASNTALMADVTPMTANPPIGTPITANKKTFTIIPKFKKVTNVNLFQYLNGAGTPIATPVTDMQTVKTIRINLAAQTSSSSGAQTMTLEVNLRNKKNNL
jgi:prepilin-type N-terminal cleavage/methylation domain-containing protein